MIMTQRAVCRPQSGQARDYLSYWTMMHGIYIHAMYNLASKWSQQSLPTTHQYAVSQ